MTRHRSSSLIQSCFCGAVLIAATVASAWGQSINAGGVVDAASFAVGRPVSAGNIVAIFGSNLASKVASSDTVPLSTTLANVTVTFNGKSAALQFVAPGQINAQIPWDVLPIGQSGTVNAIVTSQGVPSPASPVVINQFGPGVYVFNNHALAINATDPSSARYGSFAAPPGSVGVYTGVPAQVNDILIIYAGGLGAIDTVIPVGAAPDVGVLARTTTQPTVLVNNVPAPLLFSGMSPGYPGVYQVNIRVPQVGAGNALPFQIQMGGITSTDTANIAVQ
jgi:uncharacterized protein (TIGR03437 family)